VGSGKEVRKEVRLEVGRAAVYLAMPQLQTQILRDLHVLPTASLKPATPEYLLYQYT